MLLRTDIKAICTHSQEKADVRQTGWEEDDIGTVVGYSVIYNSVVFSYSICVKPLLKIWQLPVLVNLVRKEFISVDTKKSTYFPCNDFLKVAAWLFDIISGKFSANLAGDLYHFQEC